MWGASLWCDMGVFRGRKLLGSEIRLGVQCRDGNRTPNAPTAAPTYRVYTEAGTNVVNGSLPPTERYTTTGLFEYMLPLNTSFSTGRHYVRYAYAISGTNYVDFDAFEVVAGGNTAGTFTSLFFLDKPDSDWVVGITDQGTVSLNRGPRI